MWINKIDSRDYTKVKMQISFFREVSRSRNHRIGTEGTSVRLSSERAREQAGEQQKGELKDRDRETEERERKKLEGVPVSKGKENENARFLSI